jgi:hypothetical protein
MTMNEKRQLGQSIRSLPPEHLRGVWEIVSDGNTGQHTQEELEFDIDTLPVRKTRQLETYVKNKLAQIKKLKSSKKGGPGASLIEKQSSYVSATSPDAYTPTHILTPAQSAQNAQKLIQ